MGKIEVGRVQWYLHLVRVFEPIYLFWGEITRFLNPNTHAFHQHQPLPAPTRWWVIGLVIQWEKCHSLTDQKPTAWHCKFQKSQTNDLSLRHSEFKTCINKCGLRPLCYSHQIKLPAPFHRSYEDSVYTFVNFCRLPLLFPSDYLVL